MASSIRRAFTAPMYLTAMLFLSLVLSLVLSLGVQPAAAKYAAIVVDATTGDVLHSVNADTRNYPASLTKLMTLYLLFESVDAGRLSFNSKLKISRRASRRPASKLGLRRGRSISVKNAISALIIKSANDVATVVAEAIGGSEKKFALLMTKKARQLGMSRTTFRNASGLPHRGQLSTARDMATLTRKIIAHFPHYYHLFSRQAFIFQGQTYRTRNKVLKTFPGAEGMKTGYIHASGYNLITTAKRGGNRIIGVIFGGNSSRSRNRHMKKILNREFAKLGESSVVAVTKKKQPVYRTTLLRSRAKVQPRIKRGVRKRSSSKAAVQSKKSRWGIQVGAFYSRRPAQQLAQQVSKRYPIMLGNGHIVITPLRKSRRRILYRARIIGIGKSTAYQACRILKKRRKPCLEVRLPGVVEVASR